MFQLNDVKNDNICALSTSVGHSAVAIIRVSGIDSFSILNKLCQQLKINLNSKNKKIESHKAYLTYVYSLQNEKIDQVLATYFNENQSYTGESSFEISCHGNPLIIKKIINRIIELGARQAYPGEFTFRAFINNKIDLIQAEAILSLIESQSEEAAKVSLRQLDGKTSELFKKIESEIIWCLAHIEASIDFSTEGIDVVSDSGLIYKLNYLKTELEVMAKKFQGGQIIQHGIKIALIGKPNVGKSSLLNALVQSDRAIVTEIAGTTRDIIEAQTQYNNMHFYISDTAGIRETNDLVEKIGVSKSLNEIKKSDLNIFVLDSTEDTQDDFIKNVQLFNSEKFIILCNKVDLVSQDKKKYLQKLISDTMKLIKKDKFNCEKQVLFISSFDLNCRSIVLEFALSQFENLNFLDESIVSSARQIEMVNIAFDYINKSIEELNSGFGSEFIAQTLKEALLAMQKVLGHVYDDQILDRVFKEFCLGK